MCPDASSIAASVAKSAEVDRTSHPTQRSSEIAQDQLLGESVAAMQRKAPDAASQVRREKIRQDRERRRRELEHRLSHPDQPESDDEPGEDHPSLDAVA